MKYTPPVLITVLGPTATGKTRFASRLAHEFDGEIISADSRQVYRKLNIGTGKDYDDYCVNGYIVPYHLIDILDPQDEFDVYQFKNEFYNVFHLINQKNRIPFLVGGTGLYLSAVLQNYNFPQVDFDSDEYHKLKKLEPEKLKEILLSFSSRLHNTTDFSSKERMIKAIMIKSHESGVNRSSPEFNSLIIGIKLRRELVKSRITERLHKRLKAGMIEETENLLKEGISHQRLRELGLEYKYISFYLSGELDYNQLVDKLNTAIHRFSKRQMTWFRKMEREGVRINWLHPDDLPGARELIHSFLSQQN
ncbi:MAG: tRNA (adenosine(37)-N6)-dimethylallyltransferase MiaA [Ignavibacteriaceae bacterium]